MDGTLRAGARETSAPQTVGLLALILLSDLYLHTSVPVAAGPGPGFIAMLAWAAVVLWSALMSTRAATAVVWLAAALSAVVYGVTTPWANDMALVAACYAPVIGTIGIAVHSLRRTYERETRAAAELDAANARAAKTVTELSALLDVSQMSELSFDLGMLFQSSMAAVSRALRMHRGTLALYDEATQELKVKYAFGLTPAQIAAGRYRLGEGIHGTVMSTGQAMAIPNIGEEPIPLSSGGAPVEALSRRPRTVAILCMPVRMEGRTIGVLSVDRAPVDDRTLGDDVGFLTILASIFGQALRIQQMVDHALRQERLAALGQLATSVAHEVRNPLAGIRGAAELLQSDDPLPVSDAQACASLIVTEVDRLARVVEQLLRFGDHRRGERAKHDLVDILDRVLTLVGPECDEIGIEIIRRYGANSTCLEADGDQLAQVFLNLARNAVEAMPNGGTLIVEVHTSPRESVGDGRVLRYIEVIITDTGVGIPQPARERVFDPLFTTKRKGTGIGLALSRRLIEEHDGYIEVRSPEVGGTSMVVTLPSLASEPSTASTNAEIGTQPNHGAGHR